MLNYQRVVSYYMLLLTQGDGMGFCFVPIGWQHEFGHAVPGDAASSTTSSLGEFGQAAYLTLSQSS